MQTILKNTSIQRLIYKLLGVSILKAFKSTTTENWLMTAEMMDYIEEENITEFADLMLYARHNRRLVCFYVLLLGR